MSRFLTISEATIKLRSIKEDPRINLCLTLSSKTSSMLNSTCASSPYSVDKRQIWNNTKKIKWKKKKCHAIKNIIFDFFSRERSKFNLLPIIPPPIFFSAALALGVEEPEPLTSSHPPPPPPPLSSQSHRYHTFVNNFASLCFSI